VATDALVIHMEGISGEGALTPLTRSTSDPVQILYTSGSTGMPKGVVHSHGTLWAAIGSVAGYLGITPDDRVASLLPFTSVYGLNQLLCSVLVGAALVVERSPLAHQCASTIRELEVTVLAAVPPLWLQLLSSSAFTATPIPTLRILQNAGGHLPVEAVRRLRAAQPRAGLVLQYGLTEVIRSTFLPPEEVDTRPTSIGRAIPGAEVYVLRKDLTPCPPGEIGELVHCGPTVALGYWNDPEGTARVFRPYPPGPAGAPVQRAVFSGDLVRRDEAGYLHFVGRRDRMIKSLGHCVSPDEVASILFDSGEIADAMVTAEPDEQRGNRVVAHLVLAAGGSLERLRAFCALEMPRHMQPARFETHVALPRTASGKHDLNAFAAQPIPVA
jgi:acyl-coenzyme A synthetase/AMP-(fatty) acid ligase